MAFQRDEFINYMFNIGNKNPSVYCKGLESIEKLLKVDVDAEYDKDGCDSLYGRLQKLRIRPEEIGKNDYEIRTYVSRLKKYIEYRDSSGQLHSKNDFKEPSEIVVSVHLFIGLR